MPTGAGGDEGGEQKLSFSAVCVHVEIGVRCACVRVREETASSPSSNTSLHSWFLNFPPSPRPGCVASDLVERVLCQRSHGSPENDPPPAFPAAIPLANGNFPSFPLPSNCCQQQKKELVSLEWCGGQICDTCFYLMARQQLGKLTLQAERVESNLGTVLFQ